ncbi:MAG: OapC/ArvC family zinc-ribbon domain-containing protein [Candidatus Heimdallarchaeota archaeon]
MEFICDKCNARLEKTGDLLLKGCTSCGSKVFKTISSDEDLIQEGSPIPRVYREKMDEYSKKYKIVPRVVTDTKEDESEQLAKDNIPAVKLKRKGVYEVNLESLFRDKKSDPIILSGKTGVYRIEILPTGKKE